MAIIKLSGKSADVRATIALQLKNQLPGFTPLSMAGRTGEPQGSPGSSLTGSANLVRLTTSNRIASRFSDVLHSLPVLNTPNRADTAPVRHAVFLRPYFIRYGRVASSTYNTRKGKTAGRLYSVFKYPTTPLNTGYLNENRGHQS